jgi:hypothetical protein
MKNKQEEWHHATKHMLTGHFLGDKQAIINNENEGRQFSPMPVK